jgi:hypothetical protein
MMLMIRTLLPFIAVAAALFMQTGLCPHCIVDNCNRCEPVAPEPEMHEHSCCADEEKLAFSQKMASEPEQCQHLDEDCTNICIESGPDVIPLPKALKVADLSPDGLEIISPDNTVIKPVIDKEIPWDSFPPPLIRNPIDSTVLIL